MCSSQRHLPGGASAGIGLCAVEAARLDATPSGGPSSTHLLSCAIAEPFKRGLIARWLPQRPCCWPGVEGSRRCPEQEVRRAAGRPGGEPWRVGRGRGECREASARTHRALRCLLPGWPGRWPAVLCGVKRKLRVEGPRCSGPPPWLKPHMAKVHRRLAIKGRTSL